MENKGDIISMKGTINELGYGTISKLVMKDKNLSPEAKAIYAYICSYTGAGNEAFPGMDLIAHDLCMSKKRIEKHRKMLVERGYIDIKRSRLERGFSRNIYVVNFLLSAVHSQNVRIGNVSVGNVSVGNVSVGNDCTNNNSSKNNIINNNSSKNNKKDNAVQIPFEEIVSYLNSALDRDFSYKSKATQKLIKARFSEGYTVSDFKHVIDVKKEQWQNDKVMSVYLRPETLFGSKFDTYKNQKHKRGYVDGKSKQGIKDTFTDF